MPRARKNGQAHDDQRHPSNDSDRPGIHRTGSDGHLQEVVNAAKRLELFETIALLLSDDEGWLRAVPQDLGNRVFFKWKFSRGEHAGSYVMWVCDDGDLHSALKGLYTKRQMVYEGLLKPTPDHPYD